MVKQVTAWMASMAAASGLAACGGEPAPAPSPTTSVSPDDPMPAITGPERRILAFGDSLFAGYGLQEGESYPARLEIALRARGVNARVTNAGVSGDTTQAGLQRLPFTLDNGGDYDLAIVELGGNDLLRQLPPAQTRANLRAILDELQERDIPVLLMGLRAPPNLGAQYQGAFDAIYPDLAREYDAELVPFFLESVWNRPQLIQQDRVHPTADGIEAMVAATVDEVAAAVPQPD
ncbi:arylesterase [Croceibacterium ferulae]|uniref:arylesterase n=1 Tax=Croceibacterium ferulae TaxID=1854641 RepID=UPI001F4DF839|nr:arylesterase [Croceibacterium ferulae]